MVCTYEQARELKKLKVPQDGFFTWGDVVDFDEHGNEKGFVPLLLRPSDGEFDSEIVGDPPKSCYTDDEGGVDVRREYSAFTSDELSEMLPDNSQCTTSKNKDGVFHYRTVFHGNFHGRTLAEALAAGLISLLQQGVLEVIEQLGEEEDQDDAV